MTLEAFRNDDATIVEAAAAREAWARSARPVLVQVARRYGSLTTPDHVGGEVQALSGIRTREPVATWIDDILDAVDVECVAREEPLLSAFCVGADGRVADRYKTLAVSLDAVAAGDIEMHAATQRLEAHRLHGAVLPVDGGKPALSPQVAKTRASAPKTTRTRSTTSKSTGTRAAKPKVPTPIPAKKFEPPRSVCPTCFLQMPASGRCDNCDD